MIVSMPCLQVYSPCSGLCGFPVWLPGMNLWMRVVFWLWVGSAKLIHWIRVGSSCVPRVQSQTMRPCVLRWRRYLVSWTVNHMCLLWLGVLLTNGWHHPVLWPVNRAAAHRAVPQVGEPNRPGGQVLRPNDALPPASRHGLGHEASRPKTDVVCLHPWVHWESCTGGRIQPHVSTNFHGVEGNAWHGWNNRVAPWAEALLASSPAFCVIRWRCILWILMKMMVIDTDCTPVLQFQSQEQWMIGVYIIAHSHRGIQFVPCQNVCVRIKTFFSQATVYTGKTPGFILKKKNC
jgi:hypothetical protein